MRHCRTCGETLKPGYFHKHATKATDCAGCGDYVEPTAVARHAALCPGEPDRATVVQLTAELDDMLLKLTGATCSL